MDTATPIWLRLASFLFHLQLLLIYEQRPKDEGPSLTVCSARGCAARSERGIAHVHCPIYKNGHDNTNMAPIGFVLVSLAATISILATTKRRRANLEYEVCKKLHRRRGISCLVRGQAIKKWDGELESAAQ